MHAAVLLTFLYPAWKYTWLRLISCQATYLHQQKQGDLSVCSLAGALLLTTVLCRGQDACSTHCTLRHACTFGLSLFTCTDLHKIMQANHDMFIAFVIRSNYM